VVLALLDKTPKQIGERRIWRLSYWQIQKYNVK
jgi:hypothetical protein